MDQDKTLEQQNLENFAAAFNDHQITDEEGKLVEDTTSENTAASETNTLEDTATSEKTEESEETTPVVDEEDETIPAVDDKGKRYIPEKRFKQTYAQFKETERENQALRDLVTQIQPVTAQEQVKSEPASDTELEVLFMKYPQFDPNSDEYSKGLDDLGGQILKANPGMSRLQIAKQTLETAKKLTSDQAKVVAEARTVKAQQSDQGITSRVLNRQQETVDVSKMSVEEKEEWLKANGAW